MSTVHRSIERMAAELLDGRREVTIVAALAPQQPDHVIRALLGEARSRSLAVSLLVADTTGAFAFLSHDDEQDLRFGRLRILTLAGAVPPRLSHLVDSVPASMWDVDRQLAAGDIACDIYAVRVAAEDHHGGFDLGNAVGYTQALLERQGVALAVEVAREGACSTGLAAVEPEFWARAQVWFDDRSPIPVQAGPMTADPVRGRAEREAIAELVAALVPAGATIQIGIGALSEAIVTRLARIPRLGVHSGTLPNGLREALIAGGFPATEKLVDTGLTVATSLAPDSGSPKWPRSVELRPLSRTHGASVLAQHPAFWAINSAFSVDLTGQVNAEWAGGQRVASGGGQSDFMRAAHASTQGGAVLALPSRTSKGKSRIVADHPAGLPVTTTAGDVDYVVTEYGIARLVGKSRTERAVALASIAHPDDRSSLLAHEGESDS